MAVAERIDDVASLARERPMTGSESGSDGRKPIHCVPPVASRPGRKRLRLLLAWPRAREVGRQLQPGQLDRAADAQARVAAA